MKILSWNIRQGGSKRTPLIIERIKYHSPDIVSLYEFRQNHYGDAIREKLKVSGYKYQAVSSSISIKSNCTFIASKYKFFADQIRNNKLLSPYVITAYYDKYILLAVYVPNGNKKEKLPFWKGLFDEIDVNLNDKLIIVGDFNEYRNNSKMIGVANANGFIEKLSDLGLIDAWYRINKDNIEYSWHGPQNGFLIDYAFISPPMEKYLISSFFSHQERIEKTSDHSILINEFRAHVDF